MNPKIIIGAPTARVTCDGHPMSGRAATIVIMVNGVTLALCDECAGEIKPHLPDAREPAKTQPAGSIEHAEKRFQPLPVTPPRVRP